MELYEPLTLQIVITVLLAMSWIAVSLRVYVRHFVLHAFKKDDWAMLLTQIVFTCWYPSQMTTLHYGSGRHMWTLSDHDASLALLFAYISEISYFIVSVMVKAALCMFLLRLANNRTHILILKYVMYSCVTVGCAFFFVLAFQCWPIYEFWNIDPASASKCMPPKVITSCFYAMSGLNIIADWTIGILPFFMLRDLQIPRKQRRMVQGILAFAAIGSTATIIRTPYVSALGDSYCARACDFTGKVGGVILWTCVEISVGITAGSLVTLKPLIRVAVDRLSGGAELEAQWRPMVSITGGTKVSPPAQLHALPKAWNGINSLSEFDMMSAGPPGVVTTIEGVGRSHEIVRPLPARPPSVPESPRSCTMPQLFRCKSRKWMRSWDEEEVVEELPERLVVEVDREFEVSSHIESCSKKELMDV